MDIAKALAADYLFKLPDCNKCAGRSNPRAHLTRASPTQGPTQPAITFFNDLVQNHLDDEQQARFNEIFSGKAQPSLVFVIGSSLKNLGLTSALRNLANATIYIVDPHPTAVHRSFPVDRTVIITASAEEWAQRVNAHMDKLELHLS
jgi:NAD-dependent SIR2 family protein deacetylase